MTERQQKFTRLPIIFFRNSPSLRSRICLIPLGIPPIDIKRVSKSVSYAYVYVQAYMKHISNSNDDGDDDEALAKLVVHVYDIKYSMLEFRTGL